MQRRTVKVTTVLQVLLAVKALFERKDWIQGPLAVDKKGEPCNMYSKQAAGYCFAGAVLACSPTSDLATETLVAIRAVLPRKVAVGWYNEQKGRTKKAIMSKIDLAIAAQPKKVSTRVQRNLVGSK